MLAQIGPWVYERWLGRWAGPCQLKGYSCVYKTCSATVAVRAGLLRTVDEVDAVKGYT